MNALRISGLAGAIFVTLVLPQPASAQVLSTPWTQPSVAQQSVWNSNGFTLNRSRKVVSRHSITRNRTFSRRTRRFGNRWSQYTGRFGSPVSRYTKTLRN